MPPPRVTFFTKGERLPHSSSYIITGQNYVQYIPPRSSSSPNSTPLLFIHGGGLTGSQWESTPDRRPGWAVLASEAGRHVYIMDGVDSGRSMRAPDSARDGEVEHRTAEEMWARFRFGELEDFEARKPFPDSAFDVQYLDALIGCQVARRRNLDDLERPGIVNVIKELAVDGKIDIIAHSHGSALLIEAMKDVAPMVRKAVLVEPGTTADTRYMVGGVKALVIWGDYIQGNPIWTRMRTMFDSGPCETVALPEVGIKGNSHFPMSDKNSDEVYKLAAEWINSE